MWDVKYQEWATHWPDQIGEYGRHRMMGHRTGIERLASARNIRDEPPFKVERKPKPLKLE